MSSEPNPPHPRLLWRMLGAYIEATYAMFGAPSELARKTWFTRMEHKICTDWIGALERFLRRLLFLDALDLAPSPASGAVEAKTRAPRTMAAHFGAAFDADDSSKWRAHFRLLPGKHRGARTRNPNRARLINALPTAPMALRLEAMIRAYNNREEEAQRLADHLHAHRAEAVAIVEEITRPPPKLRRNHPVHAEIDQLGQLCDAAVKQKLADDTS